MLDGAALSRRPAGSVSGPSAGGTADASVTDRSDPDRLFASAIAALHQQVPPLAGLPGQPTVPPSSEQTQLALAALPTLLTSVLSDAAPDTPGLARPFQRAFVRAATDRVGVDVAAQALVQAVPHIRLMRQRTAADVLASIGPLATQSVPVFQACLALFQFTLTSPPDDRTIAQILLSLLCEPLDPAAATAHDKLVVAWVHWGPCVGTLNANIRWSHVVALLDELAQPTTQPDADQVYGLAVVASYARRLAHTTVLDALWDHPWMHPLPQLMLIRGLLLLDPTVFDMAQWILHPILVPDNLPLLSNEANPQAQASLLAQATSVTTSRWNNQDLATLLSAGLGMENGALRAVVADLLDKAVKQNADLILIGFGQVPPPWPEIHKNFVLQLVHLILTAFQPNVQLVLWNLFRSCRTFTLRAVAANVVAHPTNLPRVFSVLNDLGLIGQATDPNLITPSTPAPEAQLVFELANLADRNQAFDLAAWLDRGISSNVHAFVRASLDFLERKAQEELGTVAHAGLATITSPSAPTVAAFLYALRSHGDEMNEEEIDAFKSVRNVCLQVHPRLMNLIPGSENMEPGLQVAHFDDSIQGEADSVYRSLYAGTMQVEELMKLLKRYKASNIEQERQLFACLIHTLFDEYRCLERDYPPRELGIAATVFGQIINEGLVDYIPLGIAIRYVLDALRKPVQSPLFGFGIEALQNFAGRLSEWPPLSQALLAIPAIVQGRPDVVHMIQEARSHPPTARPSEGGAANEDDGTVRAVAQAITTEPFTAVQPDELDETLVADQHEPSNDVSDKILFLVNNLSPTNLENKMGDARTLIAPELYNWFAHYLVLQRISIEPNNHPLYAQLIDGIANGPRLLSFIVRESMVKIKSLLNSETTLTSSAERTLLKNLASWLGSLTLARNKPIKHRNLAFKELLLQGYKSGRLIAAIPFVCKVLEQCRYSKVFHLPNPWLAAVLALLVELYHYAGLKLNLKFEIEVMCKALEINMNDVEPTSLLESTTEDPNSDSVVPALSAPTGTAGFTAEEDTTMSYSALLQSLFASLPEMIVIPPALNMFASNPTLKRMLCVAIERAVRDITPPVVERSAMIGNLSTKELVLKDFALEPDSTQLSRAAHQMSRDVVGSIAYVTSKDPLRTSMIQHAQRIFLDGGFNEASLPIEALSTIMNDNVDMASKMIERAAQHKATSDLEAMLAPALALRSRSTGPFADPDQALHIQYASALPDTLRLNPEGLSPAQLRVYDDFGRPSALALASGIAPTAPGAPIPGAAPGSTQPLPAVATPGVSSATPSHAAALANPLAASPALRSLSRTGSATAPDASYALQLFSRFSSDFERLVRTACSSEDDKSEDSQKDVPQTLADVPAEGELTLLLLSVTELVRHHPRRDETAFAFANKVVALLLAPTTNQEDERSAPLATSALVTLLQRLCTLSPPVAAEVSAWLLYSDVSWNGTHVLLLQALVRVQLMRVGELDTHWAQLVGVRTDLPVVAAAVVHSLVQSKLATRTQLRTIVRALRNGNEAGQASDAVKSVLHDGADPLTPEASLDDEGVHDRLADWFGQWVLTFEEAINQDKAFVTYIAQAQAAGVLQGQALTTLFLRVATRECIEGHVYQNQLGAGQSVAAYTPIDALAHLIVNLTTFHSKNQVALLHKMLLVVVLVFVELHPLAGAGKTLYRLMSSVLHLLQGASTQMGESYVPALVAVAKSLVAVQPSLFVGYTHAWMGLISHRALLPPLLEAPQEQGWDALYSLLQAQVRLLALVRRVPSSPSAGPTPGTTNDSKTSIYLGAMRIFLLLLHDVPEFLACYALPLCDLLPREFVQLRNVLLCAYPSQVRLPDPLDLSVDLAALLPVWAQVEPTQAPPTLVASGSPAWTKAQAILDAYFADGSLEPVVKHWLGITALPSETTAEQEEQAEQDALLIAQPLLNALIYELAQRVIQAPTTEANQVQAKAQTLVAQLLTTMDPHRSYVLLSAVANQLRFPNGATYFASTLLVQLFTASQGQGPIGGQIWRVLLERIVVMRPHPWGALYTLSAILRSPVAASSQASAPLEIQRILQNIQVSLSAYSAPGSSGPAPAQASTPAPAPAPIQAS